MLSMLVLIAGLYALYLPFISACRSLMKAPKEKAAGYTAVVVLCAIVLGIVVGVVGGAVTGASGYSMMGMHGRAIEHRAASEKAGAAAAGVLRGGLFGPGRQREGRDRRRSEQDGRIRAPNGTAGGTDKAAGSARRW